MFFRRDHLDLLLITLYKLRTSLSISCGNHISYHNGARILDLTGDSDFETKPTYTHNSQQQTDFRVLRGFTHSAYMRKAFSGHTYLHAHPTAKMSTMCGFHLPRVDILVATLTNLENFVRASDCIDRVFLKYLAIDAARTDQNAVPPPQYRTHAPPGPRPLRSFVQDFLTIACIPEISRPIYSTIFKTLV